MQRVTTATPDRTTEGEVTDVFQPSSILTEHEVRIIYDFLTESAGIATDADVEAINLLTNVFAELGERKASSEKPLYQTTVERQAKARRQHLMGRIED